jgi:hypothetical protein
MSKTRSRRTGCLSILGIITLAAGLFIAREVYLAVTATPGDAVDYHARTIELVEEAQPEGPDGWTHLLDAIDAMNRVNDEFDPELLSSAFDLTRSPGAYDEDYPLPLQDYLTAAKEVLSGMDEAGVFESLDRLAASPRAVRDTRHQNVEKLIEILLPELGRMRQLARSLAGKMHLEHEAGRDDEAARAFEHGMTLSRVAGSQFTLIDHLVGIAIAALMIDELQHQLVERPHDEAALRHMLETLQTQEMLGVGLALRGERILVMDAIQWTHTDDGNGDGRLILTQLGDIGMLSGTGGYNFGGWKIINMASIAFPSKKETTQLTEEYFDAIEARAAMTFAERQAAPTPPVLGALPPRQLVLGMMLPAFGRAMETGDHAKMLIGGAKLALAIELYNIETGAYPGALDDLVPDILPELPTDPYANDGRFGYKRITGDPAARAYLLYSTGTDGDDNDAAFDPEADMLPRDQGEGFDVILNMPREKPD